MQNKSMEYYNQKITAVDYISVLSKDRVRLLVNNSFFVDGCASDLFEYLLSNCSDSQSIIAKIEQELSDFAKYFENECTKCKKQPQKQVSEYNGSELVDSYKGLIFFKKYKNKGDALKTFVNDSQFKPESSLESKSPKKTVIAMVDPEIVKKAVTEVVLVNDLSIFPSYHKHSVEKQDVFVLISPTASSKIVDYHCFNSYYCSLCDMHYVDEASYKTKQKGLNKQYFRCNTKSITVVKRTPITPINTPVIPFVNTVNSNPLIPPKTEILVISKTKLQCSLNNHNITSMVFDIPVKTERGQIGFVPAEIQYCSMCKKYSIDINEFNQKILVYSSVRVLKTFKYNGKEWGLLQQKGFGMAEESPLMQSGYTVNQQDDYSSSERQKVLRNIIETGILPIETVKGYLEYFINSLGLQPRNTLACNKWKEDLDWLKKEYSGKHMGIWKGRLGWKYI